MAHTEWVCLSQHGRATVARAHLVGALCGFSSGRPAVTPEWFSEAEICATSSIDTYIRSDALRAMSLSPEALCGRCAIRDRVLRTRRDRNPRNNRATTVVSRCRTGASVEVVLCGR